MNHPILRRATALLLAILMLGSMAAFAAESQPEETTQTPVYPQLWMDEEPLEINDEPVPDPAADAPLALPMGQTLTEIVPGSEPNEALDAAPAAEDPAEEADTPLPAAQVLPHTAEGAKRAPEQSDEELIALYNIPNNWARPALIFAARTGLMTGRGDGTLSPTANTTRAEVATMLIRVLGTQSHASLSSFVDVRSDAWYYDPMSRAVAAGLFNGAGNQLMPNSPITREQAFAVLARMFGVYSSNVDLVYRFDDGEHVSSWARPTMAGMIRMGFVHGTGSKLNPKGNITRQELAQVLYNLLTGLGTSLPNYGLGRYALAADSIPAGTVFTGDVLISNEVPSMLLSNVTISGRLIIQGVGNLSLTLSNCRIGSLVLCRPTSLSLSSSLDELNVLADSQVFGGRIKQVNVYAPFLMTVDADSVLVFDGALNVPAGSKIGLLTVDRGTVVNNGAVTRADIFAKNFTLEGTGTVQTLYSFKTKVKTTNKVTNALELLDPGLSQLSAARTDTATPSASAPSANLTVTLKGFGTFPRPRYFTAEWRVAGNVVRYAYGRTMADPKTLSCEYDFGPYIRAGYKSVPCSLTLVYEGDRRSYEFTVALDGSGQSNADISGIRTQNVQARILYAVPLYSYFNSGTLSFSGATGKTVPAGTQVTFLVSSKSTGAQIRLPDGTVGWVTRDAVSVIPGNYYTTEKYSQQLAEAYVNQKGFSSKTAYLIWVSLWTQEVFIFQGSKGNWKLVRHDPCCTGANECPTPVESVEILYKVPQWTYSEYYCHSVSVFDLARGFHSWPIKNNTTNSIYDATMGAPNSNSCVRMMDEAVRWIYNNIPNGTAVEIY